MRPRILFLFKKFKVSYLIWFVCLIIKTEYSEATVIKTEENDLQFYFYSVANPQNGLLTDISDAKSINRTAFDSRRDTYFCIHGWQDTATSTSCLNLKDNILENHAINIFVVGWEKVAEDFYPIAVMKIEPLGKAFANMINNFTVAGGLNLNTTSFIGHSLGAHLAGVAGTALEGKIQLIVGLDPAGIGFTAEKTSQRLSTSSAQFVQVIHTGGGGLGYFDQLGHADYYPNGGRQQPMCSVLDLNCSHLKVLKFYGESLLTGNFIARQCDSYADYKLGNCSEAEASLMGEYYVDKNARGKYFLNTNQEPPYAENEELIFHDLEEERRRLQELGEKMVED